MIKPQIITKHSIFVFKSNLKDLNCWQCTFMVVSFFTHTHVIYDMS